MSDSKIINLRRAAWAWYILMTIGAALFGATAVLEKREGLIACLVIACLTAAAGRLWVKARFQLHEALCDRATRRRIERFLTTNGENKMKAAIALLEIHLEVMEINEPINRARGDHAQADLERDNAESYRRAIATLEYCEEKSMEGDHVDS